MRNFLRCVKRVEGCDYTARGQHAIERDCELGHIGKHYCEHVSLSHPARAEGSRKLANVSSKFSIRERATGLRINQCRLSFQFFSPMKNKLVEGNIGYGNVRVWALKYHRNS